MKRKRKTLSLLKILKRVQFSKDDIPLQWFLFRKNIEK